METIKIEPVVTRPCPYCAGTDFVITEELYSGHTFFHLHHADYHEKNRKCGLLAYDWDKENLIKSFNENLIQWN